MAMACRALGDRKGMKHAAEQSIAMEPRNPRAYIVQADQRADDGERYSASANYRMALKVAPALEQAPADLKPELNRAKESCERLPHEFESYLDSKLNAPLTAAGEGARRVKASIDILTGRRQPYTQQPQNYYFSGLPDIPFYNNAGFDWIAGLEAAFGDILSKLNGIIADQSGEFSPITAHTQTRTACRTTTAGAPFTYGKMVKRTRKTLLAARKPWQHLKRYLLLMYRAGRPVFCFQS